VPPPAGGHRTYSRPRARTSGARLPAAVQRAAARPAAAPGLAAADARAAATAPRPADPAPGDARRAGAGGAHTDLRRRHGGRRDPVDRPARPVWSRSVLVPGPDDTGAGVAGPVDVVHGDQPQYHRDHR